MNRWGWVGEGEGGVGWEGAGRRPGGGEGGGREGSRRWWRLVGRVRVRGGGLGGRGWGGGSMGVGGWDAMVGGGGRKKEEGEGEWGGVDR